MEEEGVLTLITQSQSPSRCQKACINSSSATDILRRRRTSYLSGRGEGQRRLASCTHFPDEHPLQGFHHFGLVDSISITMTKFSCRWTYVRLDLLTHRYSFYSSNLHLWHKAFKSDVLWQSRSDWRVYTPLSPPPKDQTVRPSLDRAIVWELPHDTSPTLLMSLTRVGMLRLLLSPWPVLTNNDRGQVLYTQNKRGLVNSQQYRS